MHSFGWHWNSSTADRKNAFSGFPTTSALQSAAYSSPVTNGPKNHKDAIIINGFNYGNWNNYLSIRHPSKYSTSYV